MAGLLGDCFFDPEPVRFFRFLPGMPIDSQRCRAVFQKLDRHLIKLGAEPSSKRVHGFRTDTRRVQILLAELSPKLDRSSKKLLKRLNGIRKRAGKLRDLDVQLAALRSLKVPREPRRKTQLVNYLIELRAAQEKKLHKSTDIRILREIRKRLKRAGKRFKPEVACDPLSAAKSMIGRFHSSSAPLNEELLHEYRILSKRARYAAEFAMPSASAAAFIEEIKRVQDALGDWHDWLTLTHSAREYLGEVHESPLVAELHNVTGAKYRHAVAMLSQLRDKHTSQPKRLALKSAAGTGKNRQQEITAA
jgi:CHAD domain-containing protein